jgi:hypothetical protein
MNNKKIILIIFISLCVLIGVFSLAKSQVGIKPIPEIQIAPKALSLENVEVSLNVLDKNYKISIQKGATVYEVMKNLQEQKENNFTFVYKEYSGLGIFIEGINEVKGEPGKYWIYYVNDIEASVSVSKFKLKDGDVISWKQE